MGHVPDLEKRALKKTSMCFDLDAFQMGRIPDWTQRVFKMRCFG